MTTQRRIQLLLLLTLAWLPGCATLSMWHEKSGPGAYREGDVERQSVTALHVLRSSEGATFLVPGHPNEQSIFALTVPEYTRDIDRFRENFSSPDRLFEVRKAKITVAPYEGKGYRVDVDFTSTLPVDRVVELFADSRVVTEGEYNFHIHYGGMANFLSGGRDEVSHYTYSMTDRRAEVKAGVVPVTDERGLLAASSYVPLSTRRRNFSYSVYEYRHESRIPVVGKVIATPITLAMDAVVVAVAVPVVVVLLVAEGAHQVVN